jgi:predicted Zn-dependent protease
MRPTSSSEVRPAASSWLGAAASPLRLLAGLLAGAGLLATGCITPSVVEEKQLGEELAWQAQKQHRFLRDALVLAYVQHIGDEILAAAGPQPFEYHFQVVDNDEINAFAGPAGWIYIHTGTILAAENVGELAGVVAHEIGHVIERHVAENYARVRGASVAHTFGVAAGSLFGLGNLAGVLGGWGLLATINSFGRAAELEADAFAVRVMPAAGYDPNGLVTFFETMRHSGGPQSGGFLSYHPATEDRIVEAETLIENDPMSDNMLRASDGGRLEIIQRRIELLTGRSSPHS